MSLAILIALLSLIGIVYGAATGFRDTPNPEGAAPQPTGDAHARLERTQRGKRTFWGSIIIFILVALWYGFIYESPEDIEARVAKERAETCHDILAAYNASQNFVARFVPGAEFPIIPQKEHSQIIRACEFEIHSVVFERSGEGETKQPFTAWLQYDSQADRWDLQKLLIGDQEYGPHAAAAPHAQSTAEQPEVRLPGLGRGQD